MKEIIELHERIAARVGNDLPDDGLILTRGDSNGVEGWDLLPDDLQAEVVALREKLDRLLPDDFEYLVMLGAPDDTAYFGIDFDDSPAGGSIDGTFDPERSLYEQLRVLDWQERREAAGKNAEALDHISRAFERISGPLPSAKQFQREFREETRDFIKEKRRDATRVHVMYWDEIGGIMEVDFPDGDGLREALPNLVGEGAEIVTIVAHGKPLPVDRIDALKAAAIETYADLPLGKLAAPDDGVIDVEAEVIEEKNDPPGDSLVQS